MRNPTLTLGSVLLLTAFATGQERPATIVDAAVQNGSFKTLVTAVQAAGLEGVLRGDGPFTVFAPTDAAFAKVDKKALASLLKPENKAKLIDVLKYHVVAGKVPASAVVNVKSATTLQGGKLPVLVNDGGVKVGAAKVVATDVMTGNGIIHVIDTVLMPPAPDVVDVAVAAGQFKTLVTAVQAAGLESALRGDGPFTIFAPTDAAFAKVDKAALASLLKPENKAKLQAVLKYHVVAGKVMAADAVKLTSAKTLQGGSLPIAKTDAGVTIGGAKILKTDIVGRNGVIHVIDTVLLP